MSKKQEALRRGLRSFFEDTSDEFADLEGRPLRRAPDREADTETVVVGDAAVVATEPVAADNAQPDVEPELPPRPRADAELPRHEFSAGAASSEPPKPPASAAQTGAGLDVSSITAPPTTRPATAPTPLPRKEPVPEPPGAPSSPPAHRRGQASAAPAQAEKPKPRAQAPVRRRARPAVEIGADGVSPAQAHARKGVCFAYFLNHECWRVPDAYCNSALQVCITRECPIYHLHKDALERRFAKKFKHFW